MGMAAEPEFHVLAVDDSLIDRKLIERLLKTSSYQVTTVDSGSKALEFLGLLEDDEERNRNHQCQPSVSPDSQQVLFSPKKKDVVEVNLIITDYCMPGMTGYDLLKKVKESSTFSNIPVVIMSSENVPSRISRCLEEGAEEFILKPVRLSDVNRLKPHMLRAKYGDYGLQKQDVLKDCQNPERKLEQQTPSAPALAPESAPQQPQDDLQRTETQQQLQQQHLQHNETQQQPLQQQRQQQHNNNKRKSVDEGLSPDRSRPRYEGITTAV